MQSKATTVDAYLAELPPDRRAALEAVRRVIRRNLDKQYVENMSYGMIAYCVPHRVYPQGYHCNPKQALPFAALASQKNYMSVYLCTYMSPTEEAWFRSAWKKTGKKLDMGKSCIRFKTLDDLALDVIGEAIRRVPAKTFIELYEKVRRTTGSTVAKRRRDRPVEKLEERIERHRDGSVCARGQMFGNQLHGYWEWFRKDGSRMRSGTFERGKQVGEWTTYTRDGWVAKVTQF